MRVVACGMIFLASIGFAWQIQVDLKSHLQLLYDIRKLLTDIAEETAFSMECMEVVLKYTIQSRNECLTQICRQIGTALEQKEAGSGAKIWEQMWRDNEKKLHLTEEEKEIVFQAGGVFFGKNMKNNEQGLAHYLERFDCRIETVRSEQKEKQKVYQTVSILSGLMIILLFV